MRVKGVDLEGGGVGPGDVKVRKTRGRRGTWRELTMRERERWFIHQALYNLNFLLQRAAEWVVSRVTFGRTQSADHVWRKTGR